VGASGRCRPVPVACPGRPRPKPETATARLVLHVYRMQSHRKQCLAECCSGPSFPASCLGSWQYHPDRGYDGSVFVGFVELLLVVGRKPSQKLANVIGGVDLFDVVISSNSVSGGTSYHCMISSILARMLVNVVAIAPGVCLLPLSIFLVEILLVIG
jgi:hypothetical protein